MELFLSNNYINKYNDFIYSIFDGISYCFMVYCFIDKYGPHIIGLQTNFTFGYQ